MPEFYWSEEHGVFVKECTKCKKTYLGAVDQVEAEKILYRYFSLGSTHESGDGFHSWCRHCHSARRSASRVGRNPCDAETLLEKQKGVCAICSQEISLKRAPYTKITANIDHNHKTGKVRGLLCVKCNNFLAPLEDADWLQKAQAYLAAHESEDADH